MNTNENMERHKNVAPAIELKNISKSFGPIKANKNINIRVMPGTIHGIIGENGAGKSTLMSILYGFHKADNGKIFIKGIETFIPDSQAAIKYGIGMVFQHFKLVHNFSVLENIILGAEDGKLLTPSLKKAQLSLEKLSMEYELKVEPNSLIEDLTVGLQQRVEILKALYRQADILILDEPTGVLTPSEADQLFKILKKLRDEGKTIIFITHKLREIMEITDSVSVMRLGEMVSTISTRNTNPENLAELMVGRKVLLRVNKSKANTGSTLLKVNNLRVFDELGVERVKGINFEIKEGEILGIAGVAGNGQSELLEVLGGYRKGFGEIIIKNKTYNLESFFSGGKTKRFEGVAHIPEDRQNFGLIMEFLASENLIFGYHNKKKYQHGLFMNNKIIENEAISKMKNFDVRPRNHKLMVKNFSGGNQQKLVVAREFEQNPDILLIGQPTRGVDIGAIEFIHKKVISLRNEGKAILLISVELDEIMSLSDRIAVMFDGKIMGEKNPYKTNENELGLLMAGIT